MSVGSDEQVRTFLLRTLGGMRRCNLLGLLLVISLVAAACSGSGDSGATATTVAASTGNGAADTTSPLPATTADAATTEAPTTTVPETTTTTEAPTTTTTLAVTTTAAPGPTGLSLLGDGLGIMRFGVDAESAIEFLGGIFGPPADDSGWIDSFSGFGTCPGTEVRGVRYGPLTVLFGGQANDRVFFSWDYSDQGGGDVFGLTTPAGIGLGATATEVSATYPAAEFFSDELFGDGSRFADVFATMNDDGAVSYLKGGTGCGE